MTDTDKVILKKYLPRDDLYLFNTGCAQKAWLFFGCNFIPELSLHRFVVWAPNAEAVSLVGDFNGWDESKNPMERHGGIWYCFVGGLKPRSLYKYCITARDGKKVLKSDPFAKFSQNGSDTASIVWEGSYIWNDGKYMAEREARNVFKTPMSIYELHLGSWRIGGYRELAEKLSDYCLYMGYTHVELLPLTEYPYDGSWGYQVTGYFAPTSRYGDPDDFAYFVDTLHSHGIGVIMDWVPAHFPRDEHGLSLFDGTRLFECKEERMSSHPEWGTLIFDYAMPQVQSFLVSSACYFLEEFHIDGIRVDAVSSMLYLNYGRKDGEWTPNREGGCINLDAVAFLQKLNRTVLSNYRGVMSIAEESTAYPMVTMPPEEGGLGFSFKWDMGYMHDTLSYFALDPLFRSGSHDKLSFSMMYAFSENFILAYSHDEVVHGKKSMLGKMFGEYEDKFAELRALYGFQFAHPGKKLCFMGSDFGQFIEWDYKKELDWLLLDYPMHRMLQDYYRELNRLYTRSPALYLCDKSWNGFRWLNVNDRGHSSLAFMRSTGEADGESMVCVFNLTPNPHLGFVVGLEEECELYELLSSDEKRFGGNEMKRKKRIKSLKESFLDFPYSAKIDLPPLSAVFFELRRKENKR